jgi:hypothetical protein
MENSQQRRRHIEEETLNDQRYEAMLVKKRKTGITTLSDSILSKVEEMTGTVTGLSKGT